MVKKKMKINILGTYFGCSGYDIHTKHLAQALNKYNEVSVECQKPQNWLMQVTDEELEMFKRNPEDAEVNILIGLPTHWKQVMCDNKKFIGFLVWEGDKIPKTWFEILKDERVEQIWVPSQHTLDAVIAVLNGKTVFKNVDDEIIEQKLRNKLKIVPHGVNLDIFKQTEKPKDTPFTFLYNKGFRGLRDRGGLQYALKAFHEEFGDDKNVRFMIKINPSYGIVNFENEMKKLGIEKNPGNILVSFENLPYDKLIDFYKNGDVFVNTTLAEAFHLGCLEAMSCGLPCLSTTFGGMSDFINNDNGWLLNEGELKEVSSELLYEGIKWKIPSIKEIREKMRYIYNNKEEIKTKSLKAIEKAKQMSWDNSAKIANEFLKEIKN